VLTERGEKVSALKLRPFVVGGFWGFKEFGNRYIGCARQFLEVVHHRIRRLVLKSLNISSEVMRL